MDKLFKDNEALHGVVMEPMMAISGFHSFTPCYDSNNHFEGHDITLSPKSIANSNGDEKTERENHECLGYEKTYIGYIYGNGKYPYSDNFEDQEGDQYSSCIIIKYHSWSELMKVQRINDMKNETFLKYSISKHNQTSLNFVVRKNVYVLPLLGTFFG